MYVSEPLNQSENRILDALPREVYARFLPHLKPVPLPFKQVLHESKKPIDYVYFPNQGVVSLLTLMEDSTEAEVGLVGNEGIVGFSVFLGVEKTPLRAIVQVPGDATKMKVDVFKDLANQSNEFHHLLLRYTYALTIQISQSAACHHYHSIEERCSRWLLMTHDRANSDHFPITQEFLSHMLGVRRASVTVVAGMLQKAGLISYSRGQMTILDRVGLEHAACECYAIVKREYDRVLGCDN